MATGCQRAAPATGEEDRKIFVIVCVAVVNAAAVHHHRMVQQRPVALRNAFQLTEQVSKLLGMEPIDLGNPVLFGGNGIPTGDVSSSLGSSTWVYVAHRNSTRYFEVAPIGRAAAADTSLT